MACTFTQSAENGTPCLTLKGAIDEDANFAQAPVTGAAVIVDLGGVTAINSVGIREWIKWTKTFPAGCKMTVRNCPKIVVDQINMVLGFLPSGTKVESFFVPYYSEASGNEKMVLFMNGREFKDGKVTPPPAVNDEGGEPMEMDVIETKYFKFVANG
jgi:anti-anti-sigma regulatory factor